MYALSPGSRWLTALMALLGLGLPLSPVLRSLDYPSTLVVTVIASFLYPWWGILQQRAGSGLRQFLAAASLQTLLGVLLAILPMLLVSAFTAPCDPVAGVGFLLLGPLAAAPLAALLGYVLGQTFPSKRIWRPGLLAMAVVGLADCIPLLEFFWSPGVRFYGTFFGLYHGAVYDEAVFVDAPYVWLRVKDAALASLAVVWLQQRKHKESPAWKIAFSSTLLLSVALGVAMPWTRVLSTPMPLRQTLSEAHQEGPLTIRCAPGGPACEQSPRLLRELSFATWRVQSFYGLPTFAPPTTVWAYDSPLEKLRLMGAGQTSISKPWRRELHIHQLTPGHRLLVHELVHVLLSQASQSPTGMPSRLGLLPRPGLLEGAAVAVERGSSIFTLHQWARAMRDTGHQPDVASILDSFSFWKLPASVAYTACGSFVRFLVESRGPERFLQVYAGMDFPDAYGESLDELVSAWNQYLDSIPLPPGALELAEVLFQRPSVFEKRCPYAAGRCLQETALALKARQPETARLRAYKALGLTSGDPNTALTALHLFLTAGYPDLALLIREVAMEGQPPLTGPKRFTADLAHADALWMAGRHAEAALSYDALASGEDGPTPPGVLAWRRTLVGLEAHPAVVSLATGHADASLAQQARALFDWAEEASCPSRCLLGMGLSHWAGKEDLALALLDDDCNLSPELALDTQLDRAETLWAVGRLAKAKEVLTQCRNLAGSEADREEIELLEQKLVWARKETSP